MRVPDALKEEVEAKRSELIERLSEVSSWGKGGEVRLCGAQLVLQRKARVGEGEKAEEGRRGTAVLRWRTGKGEGA